MASVATHFSGFIILFPIGLRRLLFSSSLYLKNPSHFRSKLWYFSDPLWKNLDFYFLLIALPIASFSEFVLFLSFSGHPTYRFAFFLQSLAVFIFWLLLIFILAQHYLGASLLDETFVFVFGSICFLVQYSVIGKGIEGLGGVVYGFLGGLTLGTWLLQAGFSLYTDAFALKGCKKISLPLSSIENVDVRCDLDEDSLRGISVMHFIFNVHAIVVLILSIGLFGLLASNRNLRCGEARGPWLAELESPRMMMHAISEQEMD
ncbi:APC membrane recruitment protein like [Senna tora]|uniref:APC membrane recruitment protein like n=1 Tax=Senna tora TaxID=362788 RepID=A0A835CBS2_9FABA|nr:APC membrane recruitment protein like [Senna tora]